MEETKKKDGRGGYRPGGGRPPRVKELGTIAQIDKMIKEQGDPADKLLQLLYEGAKGGSFSHLQLLCHYRYGRPTETVKIEDVTAGNYYAPIVKIIASDERITQVLQAKYDMLQNKALKHSEFVSKIDKVGEQFLDDVKVIDDHEVIDNDEP